jgi:hypothetical protein
LRTAFTFLIALTYFSIWPRPAEAQQPAVQVIRWNVQVQSVTPDPASLDVKGGMTGPDREHLAPGGFDHLVVRDPTVKESVKKLQKADRVTLAYAISADQKELKSFTVDTIAVSSATVPLALLVASLICFFLYWLLSGLHPMQLIIGEDNRYSNSKFQIALWFGVLITTYVATILLRAWSDGGDFLNGVNIPKNLLLISGLSAFTFGAAKGITTSKVNEADALGKPDAKNSTGARPNLLKDLTHDDGFIGGPGGKPARPPMLDLGDFQMVVVTVLAVAVYLGVVYHFLGSMPKTTSIGLPDVDTTILATFGLGQGAYLTKKAVGNVGQS